MSNSDENSMSAALFGRTPDCLPVEDLQPILDGQRGDEARRSAETHVATCSCCRTTLSLLRDFDAGAVRPEERADVRWIVARLRGGPTEAPWWKRLWSVRVLAPALAAATVIALAIGLQMRHSAIDAVPYSSGGDTMRSLSVDGLSPVGDIGAPPRELQWRSVAGASRYRVTVLEVDRTELWNSITQSTRVALPQPVRDKVVPLKNLLWQVTAMDAAGNVLADSGLRRFRLTENGH